MQDSHWRAAVCHHLSGVSLWRHHRRPHGNWNRQRSAGQDRILYPLRRAHHPAPAGHALHRPYHRCCRSGRKPQGGVLTTFISARQESADWQSRLCQPALSCAQNLRADNRQPSTNTKTKLDLTKATRTFTSPKFACAKIRKISETTKNLSKNFAIS